MKTQAAECAKEIRKILKDKFPNTKFSVRSSNFSMGDAVDVSWTDGVCTEEIKKYIGHFQYGHFNAMADIYENSNSIDGLPQTKYLQCHREISQSIMQKCFEFMREYYNPAKNLRDIAEYSGDFWKSTTFGTAGQYIYHALVNINILEDFQPKMMFAK